LGKDEETFQKKKDARKKDAETFTFFTQSTAVLGCLGPVRVFQRGETKVHLKSEWRRNLKRGPKQDRELESSPNSGPTGDGDGEKEESPGEGSYRTRDYWESFRDWYAKQGMGEKKYYAIVKPDHSSKKGKPLAQVIKEKNVPTRPGGVRTGMEGGKKGGFRKNRRHYKGEARAQKSFYGELGGKGKRDSGGGERLKGRCTKKEYTRKPISTYRGGGKSEDQKKKKKKKKNQKKIRQNKKKSALGRERKIPWTSTRKERTGMSKSRKGGRCKTKMRRGPWILPIPKKKTPK